MSLVFVLVEEMNNSGTWRPSADLVWQCSYFLAAELVIGAISEPLGVYDLLIDASSSKQNSRIMCFKSVFSTDVTKHAVLGKFNEIRPGVYREYMRDVCEKVRGIPRV